MSNEVMVILPKNDRLRIPKWQLEGLQVTSRFRNYRMHLADSLKALIKLNRATRTSGPSDPKKQNFRVEFYLYTK